MARKRFPAELVRAVRRWNAMRRLHNIERTVLMMKRQFINDFAVLDYLMQELNKVRAELKDLS